MIDKEKVYDIIYSGDSKTWLNRLSEVMPREDAKKLLKHIRNTIRHFVPEFGYSDGVDLSDIELQQDIDNEIEIFFYELEEEGE